MTLRHTLALSFAAALLSVTVAGTAMAASMHHPAHAATHHAMRSHGTMARSGGMAGDADHSADQLNAQSLTRTQGQ